MPEALQQLRPKSHQPQRIPFVVGQGGTLTPANGVAGQIFEKRKYSVGREVFAQVTQPRNPGHWRRAHAIGELLVQQCEDFKHMDAHAALKVVQLKGGIGCDYYELCGEILRVPQSLSFESMDQGTFNHVYLGFCRWIAENVWPELTPAQVAAQADAMGGA